MPRGNKRRLQTYWPLAAFGLLIAIFFGSILAFGLVRSVSGKIFFLLMAPLALVLGLALVAYLAMEGVHQPGAKTSFPGRRPENPSALKALNVMRWGARVSAVLLLLLSPAWAIWGSGMTAVIVSSVVAILFFYAGYFGIVLFCFTRYSLQSMLVAVLLLGLAFSALVAGSDAVRWIGGVAVAGILLCGFLLLKDHDPLSANKNSNNKK